MSAESSTDRGTGGERYVRGEGRLGSDREAIRRPRGCDGVHQTERTRTVTSERRGIIPFFFYVTIFIPDYTLSNLVSQSLVFNTQKIYTRLYIVTSGIACVTPKTNPCNYGIIGHERKGTP